MKFRSAFAFLSITVALAACGQRPYQKAAETAPAPAAAGHSGPPAVSPLQQPIETGTTLTPVAVAEASTMNTAMFRATGSGWAVTADSKNAVLERTGAKSVGISVRRLTYARGVEFIGTLNGNVFSLNLQAEACRDGDVMTPFTARLRMGTQRLSGCAAATETMPKAQTRASSAPPKPKNQPKPAKPAAPATPATTTPKRFIVSPLQDRRTTAAADALVGFSDERRFPTARPLPCGPAQLGRPHLFREEGYPRGREYPPSDGRCGPLPGSLSDRRAESSGRRAGGILRRA